MCVYGTKSIAVVIINIQQRGKRFIHSWPYTLELAYVANEVRFEVFILGELCGHMRA